MMFNFIIIQGSGNNEVILNLDEQVKLVNRFNCNGMKLTKKDISMLTLESKKLGDVPYTAERFFCDSGHISVIIKGKGEYETEIDRKFLRKY